MGKTTLESDNTEQRAKDILDEFSTRPTLIERLCSMTALINLIATAWRRKGTGCLRLVGRCAHGIQSAIEVGVWP